MSAPKARRVAGDRRRHAQPRIGVDIGRADKALHQLVGDVIILGEQLAGEIEGDRVRSVRARRYARRLVGDAVERVVPARRARVRRRHSAASDAAGADRGPASRRAPSPSSTAGRNWPDAPGRRRWPRRPRRPAPRARRSRRRNRGMWCAPAGHRESASIHADSRINRRRLGSGPGFQISDEMPPLRSACAAMLRRRRQRAHASTSLAMRLASPQT